MSTFDIQTDAPGLLKVESLNITTNFSKTGPTTGRVSWNIPAPASGCEASKRAYNGIIITIDTSPINTRKQPTNGSVYEADSNIDDNLFVGDKIGTSKVIGAFYSDLSTTILDISGLSPNTAYYVSAFPVDSTYRYYVEGIHAYSQELTNKGSNDTNGYQRVVVNQEQGISGTDSTGLISGTDYNFNIQIGLVPAPKTPINKLDCHPHPSKYDITVSGSDASTYGDLVNEINKQLLLIDSPYQSTIAPNTGTLYFDGENLFNWNGEKNEVLFVIIQDTQPNNATVGEFWYNPSTHKLNRFDVTWHEESILTSPFDPLNPIPDMSYWIDGTNGYVWDGTIWNKKPTIIQSSDPSVTEDMLPGSYWFKTNDGIMHKWDNLFEMWTTINVIQSEIDPNSIPANYIWYNESNNKLYTRNAQQTNWNESPNVSISEKTPSTPAEGKLWYNPQTTVLYRYTNKVWVETQLIISATDPSLRNSGDLWWNINTASLTVWDDRNELWTTVVRLYEGDEDPSTAATIGIGTIWLKDLTDEIFVWNSKCFVPVAGYVWSDNIIPGQVWYNNQTDNWFILNGNNEWESIAPTKVTSDPNDLPSGTKWYSQATKMLQHWNGLNWINLSYSTKSPAPNDGTSWFNLSDGVLYTWINNRWTVADPKSSVEIDCHGNLFFVDTSVGSMSFIQITDSNLFSSLAHGISYASPVPGADGASDTPSYNEIGVGTDGTTDSRLNIANNIRFELGYPVIDVELTPEQLDYVITKALSELRAKSGLGYKNGYFFLNTLPEIQRYQLTNKIGGFNKIVDVLSIQRVNSLANGGHDSGIYGQIFANFLYNAGNFDMLSYHLMTEYKKTYELIFAQRIQFNWNEQTRELFVHQRMPYNMLVAIEATVERTEQDIMSDRLVKPWIQRYATALARVILAEIRGKYTSLPGPGGSVTLNANELRLAAKEELDQCLMEIDNYLVDNPAEWGSQSTLCYG